MLNMNKVDALRARAQQDIDAGYLPACQFALAMDGEVLVAETLGDAPADARFAIWSSSKPVFSSVVWQLMGEGHLSPETLVVDLWPEFAANGKDAVTVEHLLTFTAGFPEAELDLELIDDRDARATQMEGWTLDYEPGTEYAYHGLSAHWVLAELVMRITGEDHRAALRDRVLDPLGLDRLELGVPQTRQGDVMPLVTTGAVPTMQEVADALGLPALPPEFAEMMQEAFASSGASPDANLIAFQQPHVVAAGMPGGGAVSDAASVALFYQALLHDPKGLWDPAIRRDVTTNVRNNLVGGPLKLAARRTLGFEVQGDDEGSRFRPGSAACSPGTFGQGGAAGQIAWADPETGLSFSYLTNGSDLHFVRAFRRVRELSEAAAACLQQD